MIGVDVLRVQEFETKYSLGYNGSDYFSPENRYVNQLQLDHKEFEELGAEGGSFVTGGGDPCETCTARRAMTLE